MKIIHVAHAPEGYGIGTFLLSLARIQKEKYGDQDVAIAFHTKNGKYEEFAAIGIPIYCFDHKSARNFVLFFDFYKIFKKYDIVNFHSHSPWAFSSIICQEKDISTFHGARG